MGIWVHGAGLKLHIQERHVNKTWPLKSNITLKVSDSIGLQI